MSPSLDPSSPSAARGAPASRDEAAAAKGAGGEHALLLRAKQGDQDAFATLLVALTPRLRRLVGGMGGPQGADSEELLQEASLQLYRALPRYEDLGHGDLQARAWCYRVAMNVALMAQRRARRRPPLALGEGFGLLAEEKGAFAPAPTWAPPPDEAASLRERGREVDAALERLPDKYRIVLWLADVENHTLDEVAIIVGITLPTAKARLLRARAFVRQWVGKQRPRAHPDRPAP